MTPELVSAIAYHEAGHAVAIVTAFRDAKWLPLAPPPLPVRYVEVIDHGSGWTGCCVAMSVYSTAWPVARIAPRYCDLMGRQIIVELAGGIAEAIYRGERRASEVLAFAESRCCIDADLDRARAVLAHVYQLTGRRYDAQDYVEPVLAMLLEHWSAVEALANELIVHRRIEGRRIEQIIDRRL